MSATLGSETLRKPFRRTGAGDSVREVDQPIEKMQAAARLPIVALVLWLLLVFLVPAVSQALNLVDIFAFPLGYFMAAQGSLIALVLVGLVSARWQDRRDARSGSADH